MDDPRNGPNPSDQPILADLAVQQRVPSPGITDEVRGLIRWVYTNNPFYVISAALVFYGLRSSFDTSGSTFQTGALAIGLTAYTLLLASAAWFLIRYGNLWEDVRTLLLLVVLMLLAISVSFDGTLAVNTQLGIPLFTGGLVFAVGLSEALLRGIRLRLPIGFRLPYHATLALFFLYPVVLSAWIRDPDSSALHWGLFGFSAVAGGVFLALLPAIRRGPDYAGQNGSPWRWPWYPWVLFGVLGLGVCMRAYYLCISMHFVGSPNSIFGLYFLVPFLWVVNVLLLEAGLVSRQKQVLRLALLLPTGLVALAMTASPAQATDLGFLQMFRSELGASPLFWTLSAVGVFYMMASLSGVAGAWVALSLTAAAFAVCRFDTFNPATLATPEGAPLVTVAILYLAAGARNRNAVWCLLGAWCLVFAPWIDFHETFFGAYRGAIPVHLLLAIILVVGAIFRDALGKRIQELGALSLFLLAFAVAKCDPSSLGNPPHAILILYPLLAAAVAVLYGLVMKNRWYFLSAAGSLGSWLLMVGWSAYRQSRQTMAGLDYVVWGALSFLAALAVSLSKMGIPQRLYARWRKGK